MILATFSSCCYCCSCSCYSFCSKDSARMGKMCFQAQKRRLRHAQTAGPWRADRACRQRPQRPNVAFWTYKKSSRLRAFQAQKRRLRHAQTAGPWRTDRACRQRPQLPNVAFWNYTKSSHLLAFQAQKRRLRHAQQQGPEGRKSIKIATKNCLM